MSSKTVDLIWLFDSFGKSNFVLISCMRRRMGSSSRIAIEKATYSAAVVLRVMSVCNLLDHMVENRAE